MAAGRPRADATRAAARALDPRTDQESDAVAVLLSALGPIVFAAALLAGAPSASAAGALPNFNIEPGCRAATTAAVSPNRDENACKADENTARAKLKEEWGQYNASQRDHCVRLSSLGGSPSYVELLTCLELAKVAADLPNQALENGGRINR